MYFLDAGQLIQLQQVMQALFGDGSTLTPDKRRDLANTMDVLLDRIEKQVLPE